MFFSALVGRSVARAGQPFVGLLALLAGFQIALVLVASSFEREGSFAQLAGFIPGFVQRTLGSTFGLIASFQGFVAFGYFHPIVVIAMTQLGIYLATEPAGEVEGGLVDLLLARPLARHWIVTRSLVVMAGCTAIVVAAMVAATFFGLRSLAPDEASGTPASTIMTLAIHLLAVTWCFGALALAVASRGRRRLRRRLGDGRLPVPSGVSGRLMGAGAGPRHPRHRRGGVHGRRLLAIQPARFVSKLVGRTFRRGPRHACAVGWEIRPRRGAKVPRYAPCAT